MELPFFLPGAGDWLPIPKTLGTGKVRKPQPLPGQTPSSPPSFEPRPAGAAFRWQACKRRLPTGKARWQPCKRRRQSRRRRLQTCRCRPRSCKRRLQVRKTTKNGPLSPKNPVFAPFAPAPAPYSPRSFCWPSFFFDSGAFLNVISTAAASDGRSMPLPSISSLTVRNCSRGYCLCVSLCS